MRFLSTRSLHLSRWAAPLATAAALAAAPAFAQEEPITKDNIINGTMEIEFKTRTSKDTSGDYVEGSPRLGVQDKYKFDISAAETVVFTGEIVRQPNIYTKTMRKLKQGAALGFDITLAVLNPKDLKQKKTVGKWVGNVPIDTSSGAYDLAGGVAEQRPLRIAIDQAGSASAFVDNFGGRMMGKAEKKDNLAEYHYKRLIGKREVTITVKKSDPMGFDSIVLAKGPAEKYPRTKVSGRLDYDYETGNWYTDGIRFVYTLDGKEIEDTITGSIKWVEDANREANGKGAYEFNLRFNEAKHKSESSEGDAFEKMSDEDAFFAVDNSIPCLTGKIEYVDTFIPGTDTPSSSKVTYALNANKLTKQQVINFIKLWVICVGPTNDE